jgi:hypothetical protein
VIDFCYSIDEQVISLKKKKKKRVDSTTVVFFFHFLTELKSTKFKSELELQKDTKAIIKEAKLDTLTLKIKLNRIRF